MRRRNQLSQKAFPYLMCTPALIVFTVFVIAPFIVGIITSFFRWDGISPMKFIGFNNYIWSFEDSTFWLSIKHTVIYAFFVTILKNVVGLGLGMIMVKQKFMKSFFRVSAYLPVTFSYVVIGVLWAWIYNPIFGLLNKMLEGMGLSGWIQGWLSDPKIALYSIMAVDVWKWMGFHMVLYMAGLQSISKDLYEAADIDGANRWKKFWHVTVPQLNSTLVLNIVMSITGAFMTNYNLVKVMTDGGPYSSTEVALTYIVRTAFTNSALGKANAMSIILFCFVFVFAFFQLKVMTRDDYYE